LECEFKVHAELPKIERGIDLGEIEVEACDGILAKDGIHGCFTIV
jgi:hypothetical protein